MYPTKKECEDRIKHINFQYEALMESRNKLNDIIKILEDEKIILQDIIGLLNKK
jgi:hypothetical protein